MDYQVAIPSYKRAPLLKKATLATLDRYGIDRRRITIFVADEVEEQIYRDVVGPDYDIVVGHLGLVEQRKFYHEWYAADTPLLEILDDVFELQEKDGDKLVPLSVTLESVIADGFRVAQSVGARMWGINPVANPFFMADTISVGLRLIYGTFLGSYAGDPVFTGRRISQSSSAEDYENSIKSFLLYGSVVRLDYLTLKSKLFASEGGISAMLAETSGRDRMTEHYEHLTAICSAYPDLATLYYKAGNVPNIRLKRITHTKIERQWHK